MSNKKPTEWSNKFYHRDENKRRVLISPEMFKDKKFYFIMVEDDSKETIEYVVQQGKEKVLSFVMKEVDDEMRQWILDIYEHSKKTLMGSIELAKLMRERADDALKEKEREGK